MIDLHTHILPGLDDGAESIEDALAIARAAAAEGTTVIAATPHVRADFPTTPDELEAGVAEVRGALRGAAVPVELVHGGELDIDMLALLSDDEVMRFTYAQAGRYALLEFPYTGWPRGLEASIERLRGLGVESVVAHPERSSTVQERPDRLLAVVELGAVVQVTAGSFAGRFGSDARRCSQKLLEHGLVHLVASDAHGADSSRGGLAAAYRAIGDRGLARRLTTEAPAALLAGEPLPRAPVRGRRRFKLRPQG